MSYIQASGGVRLYVDDRGRGDPPVVFVHAWSMSHRLWENQVAALMGSHRVVSYDQRGHGLSDRPDASYDMRSYAEDLHALLGALDLRDVVLVGWSMGVWVVVTYMELFAGARVAKLGLVGGVPVLLKRDDWEHGLPPQMMQQLAAQLGSDRALATEAFYRSLLNRDASKPMLDWIVRTSLETPLAPAMASFQSIVAEDLRPALASIRVPAAIFHGVQDPVPLAGAREMAGMLAGARVFTFEKSGHFPQLEEPRAFNDALARFISD